jgi:hypothetical protein
VRYTHLSYEQTRQTGEALQTGFGVASFTIDRQRQREGCRRIILPASDVDIHLRD